MASNSPKTVSALTKPLIKPFKATAKQRHPTLLALAVALLFSSAPIAGGVADDDYQSSSDPASSNAPSTVSSNPASTNTSNQEQGQAHQQDNNTEHLNVISVSPYQAVYQSNVKGITAELQQRLQQTADGQWQLSNVVNILFTGFDELSQFTIANGQVHPTFYHYNNPMSKSRSSELHFDQQHQTVIDKDHPQAPLTLAPSSTDKLSAQLQIRLDLSRDGDNYQGKTYPIVDSTKLKTYHTELIGEETINVLAGTFQALKIKQFRKGKDKYQLIWFAKNHQYLILRLDVIDKGKLRDSLQLKQAIIDGQDISH